MHMLLFSTQYFGLRDLYANGNGQCATFLERPALRRSRAAFLAPSWGNVRRGELVLAQHVPEP